MLLKTPPKPVFHLSQFTHYIRRVRLARRCPEYHRRIVYRSVGPCRIEERERHELCRVGAQPHEDIPLLLFTDGRLTRRDLLRLCEVFEFCDR